MKMLATMIALTVSAVSVAPAQADPLYKATYDAARNQYCIQAISPSGRLRPVVPGARCRAKDTWEAMGLRIDHRMPGRSAMASR